MRQPPKPGQEIHPFYHQDHKRPVTRRQFLAQGFLTGAATVAAPTLMGLMGRAAQAQGVPGCSPIVGGNGMIPFICLDLAGGASIAASNVLVGGPQGQEDLLGLDGYSKLGLPPDFTPQGSTTDVINRDLGLLFHADSAFLRGIVSKAAPTTLAQVNGVVFCSRSANDTGNNELNPLYGIAKVGAAGGLLPLIGSQATESGGKSMSPAYLVDPTLRPTRVSRPSHATGLVDAGRLAEFLGDTGTARVVQAVERISGRKIDRLDAAGEQAVATGLLRDAYFQSSQLIQLYSDPDALNPLADLAIAGAPDSIFTPDELNSSAYEKTAAIMKLVVEQHAGAGCIELGGYDYHDSTRATGEARDFTAGQSIGACLEFAARKCNDLAILVFSDGSLSSNGQTDNQGGGKGIWKGDNSSAAAAFMLVYSKDTNAGRPAMRVDSGQMSGFRNQIGWFSSGGSADTSASEVSDDPARLTEAAILNYLALHGLEGEFAARLPERTIGQAAPLDDLIAFEPIRTPA